MSDNNTQTSINISNEELSFPEFTVNGTQYSNFTLRCPSFSETAANFNMISKAGTPEGNKAAATLAKLCLSDLKNKSDFDAFPSPVAFTIIRKLGEKIV
ncbi:hypothetical protein [Acetobacter pasteurianus]|uniref:Phage protein n=1 Tax=Acetobacter pasteurianus subsp. pasteurianus TaxID=481145 RepID=A0A1Y0Y2U9_ACEPA|nr:hypothetical protein [Acetobacter pasteurianus]ARW49528.1 hypothetical protein S1001342_03238 [Acetobacter pasteurianus subsp. pasteurianus]